MEKIRKRLYGIYMKEEIEKKEKKVATPLNKRVTAITFFLFLFNGMKLTMVYSYLPNLIQWFGASNVDVGYYAGFLASSVFLGRFLLSYLWGYTSDVCGRRLTAIVSASTFAIASLLFGFSNNFWYALVTRFIQGCSTGLVPICKTIVKEHCDDTNINLGMSILLSSYSAGVVLGPSFAGFLAFPADLYPSLISQDSLLGRYPALLPNLFIVVGLCITIIFTILFLPKDKQIAKVKRKSYTLIEQQDKPVHKSFKDKMINLKFFEVFRSKWCVVCSVLYTTMGLVSTGVNEVFPIFAATDTTYGGLSFQPYDIGLVLLFAAMAIFFVQIFVLTKCINKFGSKAMFIWCCVIYAICVPFLPLFSAIQNIVLKWICIILYILIVQVNVVGAFVSINIMVNNSIEDQSLIGAANGFALTLASLGRAFAPLVFDPLFAWSLTNIKSVEENKTPLGFPFNQYFIFLLLCVISILSAIGGTFLPKRLNTSPRSVDNIIDNDVK